MTTMMMLMMMGGLGECAQVCERCGNKQSYEEREKQLTRCKECGIEVSAVRVVP